MMMLVVAKLGRPNRLAMCMLKVIWRLIWVIVIWMAVMRMRIWMLIVMATTFWQSLALLQAGSKVVQVEIVQRVQLVTVLLVIVV